MSIKQRVKIFEEKSGGKVIFVITDAEFIPSKEVIPSKEDCTHVMLGWLDVKLSRVDREENESVQDFEKRLDLICEKAVRASHGPSAYTISIFDTGI